MKKVILYIIAIIISIIFLVIATPYIKKPTTTPDTPTVGEMGTFDTVVVEENTDVAQLKLSYPKLPPGQYAEVSDFITLAQEEHKKNIQDAEEFAKEFGGGAVYQTILNYTMATSTRTTSFIFELYTYTGGAHGNTGVVTFTYTNSDKKLLQLQDIFTGQTYLQTISTEARTYLNTALGEYSNTGDIMMGTEPVADNFSAWYMTDEAIVFIFGQYQVGPYVIGMPRFPLPKTAVATILNPAFK